MNTAFGLPWPSSVTVPVRNIDGWAAGVYIPASKVIPPRSAATGVAGPLVTASP